MARAEQAPRGAITPGISYRGATEADLPETNRIWREAIDAYLKPLGFPPLPAENPGLRRLHGHTLSTDPDLFLIAERQGRLGGRRAVAFGSAVARGDVWFLSMLFVEPGEQARGLGRALLGRLLPHEPDDWTLATCTDSAQPISNGLYASLGIVPRMPLFNHVGRPRAGWQPPPLPNGIVPTRVEPGAGDRLDGAQQSELDAFDRPLLRYSHPMDHAFDLHERPWLFSYRDGSGRLVGYGYTSEVGRIGPIAVLEADLLAPVFGHLLAAVEPRGASSIWLPGAADATFRMSLEAGLLIEGFPTIACWSRPFVDFTRYVPTSPGLI